MTPDEKIYYEKIKSNPKDYLFDQLFSLNKEGKAIPIKGKQVRLLNGIPIIMDEIPGMNSFIPIDNRFILPSSKKSGFFNGFNYDNPLGEKSIFYAHKLSIAPPNKTDPENGSTETTENYYKFIKCSSGTEVFEKYRTEEIPAHYLYIFIEENNENTSNFFGTACRVKFGPNLTISPQSLANNDKIIIKDYSFSGNSTSTNSLAEFAKTIFKINNIKENPVILENAIKLELLEQSTINKLLGNASRFNKKLAEWISSGVEKLEGHKLKEQNYDYEAYYLTPVYNQRNGFSNSVPTYNPIIPITLFNKQDILIASGIGKLKEINHNLITIILGNSLHPQFPNNRLSKEAIYVISYLQENLTPVISKPLGKMKGMIALASEFLSQISQWAAEKAAELNAFFCGLINGIISLIQTILSLLAMVVQNTALSSLSSGVSQMQEILEFVEDFIDLVQENLVSVFTELKNFLLDKKSWQELKNFIAGIAKKVSGLNKYFWAFFIGGILFEVLLDAVIAYFTGGASLAANAMSKIGRLSTQAEKLAKKGIHLVKNTAKKTADSFSSLLKWLKQMFEELIKAIKNNRLIQFIKEKLYDYGFTVTTAKKAIGKKWRWTNLKGTEMEWAKMKWPKEIKDNINKIFKNIEVKRKKGIVKESDLDKEFEALVAEELGRHTKLTEFNTKVINLKTKKPLGEIDCATEEFIIECKRNFKNDKAFKDLAKQLVKYLNPKADNYINTDGKQIIVIIDNLGNHTLENPILKNLSEKGVIFVEGEENIKQLFK